MKTRNTSRAGKPFASCALTHSPATSGSVCAHFMRSASGNFTILVPASSIALRDDSALTWAVRRSCENKAAVVAVDERETGPRAMLNLGHTFGHAIETGLGFGVWLHGEAVAAGMVLAARTSVELGELDPSQLHRIERLLVRAGLPVEAPDLGFERWLALMGHDKKVESGAIRFILPRGIGAAFIHGSVPRKLLQQVLTPSASHG